MDRNDNIKITKSYIKRNSDIRIPEWITVSNNIIYIERFPKREEIDPSIKEDKIVEFYSR